MSEFISCFACDNEPTQQCSRCGRPYCDDHGDELCDACLEPASGVPSFTLYRGSLLALLFGTLLAVWLLVQPGDADNAVVPQVVPTGTVQAQGETTPPTGTTPAAGATQPAGTNGTAVVTQTRPVGPTATAPAGASTSYTVAPGDTLSTICESQKPASMSVTDCLEQITALNGIDENDSLNIGQVLRIPAAP